MMQIHVQLFSILRECLPPGSQRGKATITLPEGATLADLVTHLGIDRRLGFEAIDLPVKAGWQVMVDGNYEPDMGRVLHDGERVMILPPISGG
jgi:molybdopterin converting factor small subunit